MRRIFPGFEDGAMAAAAQFSARWSWEVGCPGWGKEQQQGKRTEPVRSLHTSPPIESAALALILALCLVVCLRSTEQPAEGLQWWQRWLAAKTPDQSDG